MLLRRTAELHSSSGVCPPYSGFIYTFTLPLYLDETPGKLSIGCEDRTQPNVRARWRL